MDNNNQNLNVADLANKLGIKMNNGNINLGDIIKLDIGALNNFNLLNKFDKNNSVNNNLSKEELDQLLIKSNELVDYTKNILNKLNNNTH